MPAFWAGRAAREAGADTRSAGGRGLDTGGASDTRAAAGWRHGMNLFSEIRAQVTGTLAAMAADGTLPADLDVANVTVEPPRDPLHGDMATNAAMVLAKPAGMKPRDIAAALATRLEQSPQIARAEV